MDSIAKVTAVASVKGAASEGMQTVTLQNEKYLCVREGGKLYTLDIENDTQKEQKGTMDLAAINSSAVIAVASGETVQVFDTVKRCRVDATSLDEDIDYLCWLSDNLLALVTQHHVFHWTVATDADPLNISPRLDLPGRNVTGYVTDRSQSWCLLFLTSPNEENSTVQCYSIARKALKKLDGYCGCFASYRVLHDALDSTLMCIAGKEGAAGKLFVVEMPTDDKPNATYEKRRVSFPVGEQDTPVSISSTPSGVLKVFTAPGTLYLFDVASAAFLATTSVSPSLLAAIPTTTDDSLVFTSAGEVLRVHIDMDALVSYMDTEMGDTTAAMHLAGRAGLPCAEVFYTQHFAELMGRGDIQDAIDLVISSPGGILRTPDTILKFQMYQQVPGQPPPMLLFFNRVVETTRLTQFESVELCKLVLVKPRGVDYIKKLMHDGRLESSPELGDKLVPQSTDLALEVYKECKDHSKVLQVLLQRQKYAEVLDYLPHTDGWQPDWHQTLVGLISTNAHGAEQLAQLLYSKYGDEPISALAVVDLFVERSCVKQACDYLTSTLEHAPEDQQEPLQTRLFEVTLMHAAPQAAERLFVSGGYTKYDPIRIALLCEQVGLHRRALLNYAKAHTTHEESQLANMQRAAVHAASSGPGEWLHDVLEVVPADDGIALLSALMSSCPRKHATLCVEAASAHIGTLGLHAVMNLLQEHKAYEQLFKLLRGIVPSTEDKEVIYRYIEACCRIGEFAEVEAITKTCLHYDPSQVKELLCQLHFPSPWPIIYICERGEQYRDMVKYLQEVQKTDFLSKYLTASPEKAGEVVGAMLEEGVSDSEVLSLVRKMTDKEAAIGPIVKAVVAHDRVHTILDWMQDLLASSNRDPQLVGALSKHLIDTDTSRAKGFLAEYGGHYNSSEVGAYCERKDLPELACIAYEAGKCDWPLLKLTQKHHMFSNMVRYLIARKDVALWKKAVDSAGDCLEDFASSAFPMLVEAEDPTAAPVMVEVAMKTGGYTSLVSYLNTVRKAACDSENRALVDTELVFAYAKLNRLTDLNDLLASPNMVRLEEAGDRCFGEGLYGAARALYTPINKHERLALTLLHMGQYLEALDAAQKADARKTWKEVCHACVEAGELRIAQIAAQHLIVIPEELDGLCSYFESRGHYKELIALLRTGTTSVRSHSGVFTQLALMHARHDPEGTLDVLTSHKGKIQIPRVLKECEAHHLWNEVRFLHTANGDWDSALRTVLDHPVEAWEHESFKEVVMKSTGNYCYDAVKFYLEGHPELTADLLTTITPRINIERVVGEIEQMGKLHIVRPWLESVQSHNLEQVNDALNGLLIEEEDFKTLRESIKKFGNVDKFKLAKKLEKHSLLEMRRVAAWLFRLCERYQHAIDMALEDKAYQDAMEYVADSGSSELAEGLLKYFLEHRLTECFSACLFTCYEVVQPDVVLELAWRNKEYDMVMPYLIQVLKELWGNRNQPRPNPLPSANGLVSNASLGSSKCLSPLNSGINPSSFSNDRY